MTLNSRRQMVAQILGVPEYCRQVVAAVAELATLTDEEFEKELDFLRQDCREDGGQQWQNKSG